ncbi:hypothetical protein GOARA_064_01380 [Gordonia araii NBRC 100433]|uniref:Serine/threonine protein kinase n=1 Tax=Gordonia araii NBRC 100433 TaxID=1073574 RepID=G7H5L1_9ACTN|nr:hypothetical protein GOARA_064_01380 [Gordonia araii NBRC 100433]
MTTAGAWAAALVARACAADDFLDTLRGLDTSADLIAGSDDGGPATWLELLRSAEHLSLRLPVPGDPAGLPPQASGAAAIAGEALVVDAGHGAAWAVIPARDPDRAVEWHLYRLPGPATAPGSPGLGDARMALREAMTQTVTALSALPGQSSGEAATLRADLAAHVENFTPLFPPGADARAADVAAQAAQVLATLALASQRRASFGVSGSHADRSDARLREVASAARTAMAGAVNKIIEEFRRA